MRRLRTLPLATLGVAGALLLAAAVPSSAGGGGSNGSGYVVDVSVTFTGDAAPGGGGGHVIVRMPASCWWHPADGPYTDPKNMLIYYDQVMGNTAPGFVKGMYGPRSAYQAAAASSTPMQWWRAQCQDPSLYMGYTAAGFSYRGTTLPVTYRAFPAVNGVVTPPAPLVDPRDLADAARNAMVLPVPAVDRNPKATDTAGGTLVGLPTWFWVTNPAAVGNGTGRRAIRASVAGGTVWAEVTATTNGLDLASPAGATTCPPARAMRVWHAGASDADGCTVRFTKASVAYPGGYPVTASTAWQATWVGSDGNGGPLAGLTRQATANVPVAEAQALVTSG
jgi:hypothetical protein